MKAGNNQQPAIPSWQRHLLSEEDFVRELRLKAGPEHLPQ